MLYYLYYIHTQTLLQATKAMVTSAVNLSSLVIGQYRLVGGVETETSAIVALLHLSSPELILCNANQAISIIASESSIKDPRQFFTRFT